MEGQGNHGNGAPRSLPDGFPSVEQLLEEIADLERSNRERRDLETERRILDLRHVAGAGLIWGADGSPDYPSPAFDLLPQASDLPEFSVDALTPEILRAGMLTHGCVLVRGLLDRQLALELAEEIELTLGERETRKGQGGDHYVQFEPQLGFGIIERPWIEEGGGPLAVDSPKLMYQMLSTFDRIGLRDLIRGYLGEPVAVSAQKCTLRKADPLVAGAWHQDGSSSRPPTPESKPMEPARPGPSTSGSRSPRAGGGAGARHRPPPSRASGRHPHRGHRHPLAGFRRDRPGGRRRGGHRPAALRARDALLFDALFLHQTGSDPGMPNPRFAIESWFFGVSAFPEGYVPLAA